ncbi:MAG: hydrolase, partial [Verrucomicrobia bacterium]
MLSSSRTQCCRFHGRNLFALGFALGALAIFSSEPAQAQRPLGTDVSHYQGTGINWPAVKSAGVTFAWAKATEATNFTDDAFIA